MMVRKTIAVFSFLLITTFFFNPKHSLAADIFDLSYTLTEGGFRLELTPENASKGLRIRVDSNISTRYEVTQRIVSPLVNRDNPNLIIRDNFVIRGLTGTNSSGNFRLSSADTPLRAEDILYVSDAAGSPDSFTMVYGIRQIEEIKPGDYIGRISLTLNPISSARAPVTKILEVRVSISQKDQAKGLVEVTTATGAKKIVLNSKRQGQQSCDLLVSFKGRFQRPFSIIQALSAPLESAEGERLDEGAINFMVKGVTKGTSANQITALSVNPQNIFSSTATGEADNYFVITYQLSDLAGQKSGIYRGKLLFLLDEMGTQTRIETLELDIENERIFELEVKPQDQKYIIEFRDLKPSSPPKTSEVILEVKTNTGKAYQVAQNITLDLTNKEGKAIPSSYFTMRTEPLDTGGKLNFTDKQEVEKGTSVLFISDNEGSPDKFKVIYELACPLNAAAGDYDTNVAYSLAEI